LYCHFRARNAYRRGVAGSKYLVFQEPAFFNFLFNVKGTFRLSN
jgi:hypothetical protein